MKTLMLPLLPMIALVGTSCGVLGGPPCEDCDTLADFYEVCAEGLGDSFNFWCSDDHEAFAELRRRAGQGLEVDFEQAREDGVFHYCESADDLRSSCPPATAASWKLLTDTEKDLEREECDQEPTGAAEFIQNIDCQGFRDFYGL